ncbi:MAG: glycosyltransferase family 39 protein [Planctomycetota bacterium]
MIDPLAKTVVETLPIRKPSALRFLPWAAMVALLILHFIFLMGAFAPAICSPDANGYWAQGSLLFTTGRTWFKPESDAQYIGMHWLVTDSGKYFSRYPPGLAVVVGLVYWLLGYTASILINPVLATLSLLGLFLLVRRLVGPWWGVAGVLALAVNPMLNQHAIACDAHMAVAFCLVWGVWLLLRWSENGRLWEVFLAGLALGCIPTIRYPEALFALGIGVFLLWHIRSHGRIWLHYLVAVLGAAIPIVPLLIRNQLAFGAFYRTAYALTNEQTGFGWDYFTGHFAGYIQNLNSGGVGLFFGLGVAGMTMMCFIPRVRRVGVFLILLVVPSTLLYMAYYWGSSRMPDGTMRFLLPTYMCYIAAGLWLLSRAMQGSSAALRVTVMAVVLALNLVWGMSDAGEKLVRLSHQKRVLARITDGLEKEVRHGDVLIADQGIQQHLDFVRHWRLADMRALRPVPGSDRFLARQEDEDRPMPMQLEKEKMRAEKYRGMDPWDQEYEIAHSLHQWAGNGKVYYLGTEKELGEMQGLWFNNKAFKVMARIPLPEAPPRPEPDGMMGGGFRRPRRGDGPPGPPGGPDGIGPPGGGFPMPPGGPGFGPPGGDMRPPFGPFGDRRRGMGGPMGGPMGRMSSLLEAKEMIIAEWSYRPKDAVKKP